MQAEKLCECGCGRATRRNWKGTPRRFIKGHNAAVRVWSEASRAKLSAVRMGVGLGVPLPLATRKKMAAARRGSKNINWKGSKAGYGAIHIWLSANYTKSGICEHCGVNSSGNRLPHDWANISGKYKRKRSDYMELCRKCHKAFDMPRVMARRRAKQADGTVRTGSVALA